MQDIVEIGDRFYVLATSPLADQRTLVLKHDALFGVFCPAGDIEPAGTRTAQGLYLEGTRFLSRLQMRLNGHRPLVLGSTVSKDGTGIVTDFTNPDISREGRLVLARGTLHLVRKRILWNGSCLDSLTLTNFGMTGVGAVVSISFGADYADIFEVRGTERAGRGTDLPPTVGPGPVVILRYMGLDGVERRTDVAFSADPAPTTLESAGAVFEASLGPRESVSFSMSVACAAGGTTPAAWTYDDAAPRLTEWVRTCRTRACRIRSSNEHLSRWTGQSLADIRALLTTTPCGEYPYAGLPWYSAPFGRDGIITALQLLWVDPEIARGVLGYLAANQADRADPARDAEPGKILHERRLDEMATLGEVPFGRYYGSADATPLFVVLAGAYYAATADREFLESTWPAVERAIEWMDHDGDADGDGFVEYRSKTGAGLTNQGWKDSHDAVSHADGSLPEPPIALCEVQGYAYQAKRAAATMARALDRPEQAARFVREAGAMRTRFDRAFWLEEPGTYALALDGSKRPCAVVASNAGHCLFSGIALPGRAHRVARVLMSPEMFTGWGIRTLSSGEARFDPMSYHNGSVWPHDNAMIAAGFARYGLKRDAATLFRAWMRAASFIESYRLPELICGFERRAGHGPTRSPVACSAQAWAAGAAFMLLGACLGLSIDGRKSVVRLRRPLLPASVRRVRLDGLRVGKGRLDLVLRRERDDVGALVVGREGRARVVMVK